MKGLGGQLLRAARSATPYLMRLKEWNDAVALLEQVVKRDRSPGSIAIAAPMIELIVEATAGSKLGLASAGVLARVFAYAGNVDEAGKRMIAVERQAVVLGHLEVASAAAAELVGATGRALTALGWAADTDRALDMARRAYNDGR